MITFKTDQAFEEFINNSKNKLAKNFPFAFLAFLAYSFTVFRKTGGVFNKTYILSEIILLITFVGVYLYQVVSLGNTINNTAQEISFDDIDIIIKTHPFKFFFVTNKKAQILTANTHKIFVQKKPYPMPLAFKESVLVFVIKGISIFIVPDYLPANFTDVFLEQKKASEMLN